MEIKQEKRKRLILTNRRLDPKLRMIADANSKVNRIRAEFSASVSVKKERPIPKKRLLKQETIPLKRTELPDSAPRGILDSIPDDIETSVFIEFEPSFSEKSDLSILGQISRQGNIITAKIPLSQLKELQDDPSILHVEIGQRLEIPRPKLENSHSSSPDPEIPRAGTSVDLSGLRKVLIGIIDCQGFDFSHPDFLDENDSTKFYRIWDQGAEGVPSPIDFNYGAEIEQGEMNEAIRAGRESGFPPYLLVTQSEMIQGSHGTHVASIAAGNLGVCPNAYIVGVLLSLSEDDYDRRKCFYDTPRIADAMKYILNCAKKLEEDLQEEIPVAINISLGTNGHAHDGSATINRWIDSELTLPGRCVCVSAGNAGQEKPETEDDVGFIMGRIHTSGQIPARGLTKDIEWIVVGNSLADISENELEIWYSAQDRFSVQLKPPDGGWTEKIEPGKFIQNRQLNDGSLISVYNELYHPSNGNNCISIYLSPYFSDEGTVGVRAGKWTIRLHGEEIREGKYHGWIERDDPRRRGRIGDRDAWNFPSFFTQYSNVDNSSVNSLACGHLSIGIANMDTVAEKISITSSQGPTRDGRTKPEVAAPGTDIIAAKGFSSSDDRWISMSGTSMASPYVCGVTGLMLAVEPRLTAAQITGIIMRTARPIPGSDYEWKNDSGFGLIDPEECMKEAAKVYAKEDIT